MAERRRKPPCEQVAGRPWPNGSADDPAVARAQGLARNLGNAIERKGLSVRDVAALAGVSVGTVHNVRNGLVWPDVLVVARLEEGLGTPLWPPHTP